MSKTLYLQAQVAEGKGEIPKGSAHKFVFATILESGVKAVAEGYYGKDAVREAYSTAKTEQMAEDTLNGLLEDVKVMRRLLNESLTTSDFPIALANLRQRTLRDAYKGTAPTWRAWLKNIITVTDFKNIRGLRLSEVAELKLRPEDTDVQYTSWSEAEDGFRVANYERALKYTWEMWCNDEVGAFMRGLDSLGRGAYRTEQNVIFTAIANGLVRSTENGLTAGIPDIARLTKMRGALTARTFNDNDGNAVEYGYDMTDLIYGTANRDQIFQSLNQITTDGSANGAPNILRGVFTAYMERLWSRNLGTDYVGFDRDADWMQVAFKDGFESGPLTYTKAPDVTDQVDQGSFENHSLEVKVGHTLGAKVIDATAAIRVQGA